LREPTIEAERHHLRMAGDIGPYLFSRLERRMPIHLVQGLQRDDDELVLAVGLDRGRGEIAFTLQLP